MIVLIPAYEPDGRLLDLLRRLDRRLDHRRVVVVDDGSGPAYAAVFGAAHELGAEVLTIPSNRGKGHALKMGFAHVAQAYPGQPVVCADSDGQHTPVDVDRVAAAVETGDADMVLGARRFTGVVPARSRIGNALTAKAFALTTGRALIDTQTGLRGYPARMLPWLVSEGGDRFEYELRLLLRAAREGRRIEEVEIETVYLEENASSHFRPLQDSARIYLPLLAFALSSLLGFVVDAVALLLLVALTGQLALSAVGARLLSGTVNYTVNRRWVFARGGELAPRRSSALRYAALAGVVLLANIVLLESIWAVTESIVVAKVATELVLFVTSFVAQRHLVFARRHRHPVEVNTPAEPVPEHLNR